MSGLKQPIGALLKQGSLIGCQVSPFGHLNGMTSERAEVNLQKGKIVTILQT